MNNITQCHVFFDSHRQSGPPAYLNGSVEGLFMGAIVSQEEKSNALNFINENFRKISERQMARILRIGHTAISRWRRESGLQVSKQSVNEDYSKSWSHDMAYALGFIFADGNVSWNREKSYRALTITAAEKDKGHLEALRNKLESTKELLYSKKTKSFRLIANSKNLCLDLMGLGVIPNKSLTVKFPRVPGEFLADFIRGVIDGDGTVRYVKRKRSPYFHITISSGSKAFLDKMAEKILEKGISSKPRRINDNLYLLQYSCSKGLKLAEWIYGTNGLCLQRKFQQYKNALVAGGGGLS